MKLSIETQKELLNFENLFRDVLENDITEG